jgi:small-conductance mechanosensitive channel
VALVFRTDREHQRPATMISASESPVTTGEHNALSRFVRPLAAAVVLIVLGKTLLAYVHYLPPNFSSGFLHGRKEYFFDGYHMAFYAHIISGPLALLLGTILISDTFRRQWPLWHRFLGRLEVVVVLVAVAPSGLWMARHAVGGPIAAAGLVVLAVLTSACTALGWRAAVRRRFREHERWMWRTYLLLSSTIILRIIGGIATVTGVSATWFDPAAVWVSWVAPIAIHELREWRMHLAHGVNHRQSEGHPSQE